MGEKKYFYNLNLKVLKVFVLFLKFIDKILLFRILFYIYRGWVSFFKYFYYILVDGLK